jgi:hypothetical protein
MIIIHIIENDYHLRTRLFHDGNVEDLIKFIRSRPKGSEVIMCDENNYPLEDTE